MKQYTENGLLNCLEKRLNWYQKAIAMKQKEIEWENGFDFPHGSVENWMGACHELINTIQMMKQHSIY